MSKAPGRVEVVFDIKSVYITGDDDGFVTKVVVILKNGAELTLDFSNEKRTLYDLFPAIKDIELWQK